jgi:hypothetical protein
MLADAIEGRLGHWRVDLDRLPDVAEFVARVTRQRFPTLDVPLHSRWRHFESGAIDRWTKASAVACWPDELAKARAAFDLVIVSVLLDAGAGLVWRYREPDTGLTLASSEGLGVASFHLMASGAMSSNPADPWRVDAKRLRSFSLGELAAAFQITDGNPLAGAQGRIELLNRLGETCLSSPDLFARADAPRPGGIIDVVVERCRNGKIAAPEMLSIVLQAFGPIWPRRLVVRNVPLGDAWMYGSWRVPGDELSGIVPFHKLSQWLTYSLIEPTLDFGLQVGDVDGLTGLAEYRNGGLLVDLGVLNPRSLADITGPLSPGSDLIIEWRALSIALLDRLTPLVGAALKVDFPLARMLEGGTWTAGRQIARLHRPDGRPPFAIVSDGSTF